MRPKRPFLGSIESLTKNNTFFRRVLYTPGHMQLVVMSLLPREEIGLEVHRHTDQFFRIEVGRPVFTFGRGRARSRFRAKPGDAVIVPAGVWHNVSNPSKTTTVKLYTIYAPPHHPPRTIHQTKADAERRSR